MSGGKFISDTDVNETHKASINTPSRKRKDEHSKCTYMQMRACHEKSKHLIILLNAWNKYKKSSKEFGQEVQRHAPNISVLSSIGFQVFKSVTHGYLK